MKNVYAVVCCIMLLCTIYARFVYTPPVHHYTSNYHEEFNTEMMQLNSFEKLENSLAITINNNYNDTSLLVNSIDDLLRKRFLHSYSSYSYRDNWITTLLGNYVWQDFKFIVNPYHIIKYPMAACSQQGLVFQQMLRNHKIKFATVQFNTTNGTSGHYAVNAFYGGDWHYFDSNMEPKKIKGNPSMKTLLKDSLLTKIYTAQNKVWLEGKINNHLIARVNENKEAGTHMLLFHTITAFISNWGWLLLGIMYIIMGTKQYTFFKAKLLNKLTY